VIWELFHKFIFSKRAGALIRRIAWLSVVSIFISISAFLIVLFVMNGMNHSIEKRILALEPHLSIQIVEAKTPAALQVHPAYVKMKKREDLEVSVFESQDVVLRSAEGQFHGALARGISPDAMINMQKKVDELNALKKNPDAYLERWGPDEIPEEGEVAIGVDLANSLRVSEGESLTVIPPESLLLPPGETPKYEKVRIRKIFSTNLADVDGQYMFYQRGKALNGLRDTAGRKMGLEVWTKNFKEVNQIKEEIMNFEGVKVETWMDRNADLFFALRLEKLVIGIFLGLAGMVSAASIVGVLSLLLFQKTREIRLLKALGLSSNNILKLFTRIGLILTLAGVITGTIVGTAISYYIQEHPLNVLPRVYYDTQIPALVAPIYIIIVLVAGILIGYFGSYFPTKKITKDDALTFGSLSH
jgi:lipoprotein-releasing system permease protein